MKKLDLINATPRTLEEISASPMIFLAKGIELSRREMKLAPENLHDSLKAINGAKLLKRELISVWASLRGETIQPLDYITSALRQLGYGETIEQARENAGAIINQSIPYQAGRIEYFNGKYDLRGNIHILGIERLGDDNHLLITNDILRLGFRP